MAVSYEEIYLFEALFTCHLKSCQLISWAFAKLEILNFIGNIQKFYCLEEERPFHFEAETVSLLHEYRNRYENMHEVIILTDLRPFMTYLYT